MCFRSDVRICRDPHGRADTRTAASLAANPWHARLAIEGDGFTRAVWAKTQLAQAVEHGTVTTKDAQRLSALIEPGPESPSARQLFEEALADPESTPTSIGLLSLAQYIEEHTDTDELSDFETGLIMGFTGGTAVAAAILVAQHLHVRVKIT